MHTALRIFSRSEYKVSAIVIVSMSMNVVVTLTVNEISLALAKVPQRLTEAETAIG